MPRNPPAPLLPTMARKPAPFVIALPVYDGVDLLDVAAPYELFQWMTSSVTARLAVQVKLVAATAAAVTTRDGLQLVPHGAFHEVPHVDLLWVPGGDPAALQRQMKDAAYVEFLRTRSRRAAYVTSVCEGALLLASAGLLDGCRATTHWAFIPCLKAYPRIKVAPGFPRFVVNRRRDARGRIRYVVTGGGISSGLDEALKLIELIAGRPVAKNVQLTTQYFPRPPVTGRLKPATTCPLPPQP